MFKKICIGILAVSFLVLTSGIAAAADATIVGTINDEGMLVDSEGQTYNIADNEKGSELMEMVGKKIEVKGALEETDDGQKITVESFEVVEE